MRTYYEATLSIVRSSERFMTVKIDKHNGEHPLFFIFNLRNNTYKGYGSLDGYKNTLFVRCKWKLEDGVVWFERREDQWAIFFDFTLKTSNKALYEAISLEMAVNELLR